MDHEERVRFTTLANRFIGCEYVSEKNLLRHIPPEIIYEALEKNYIKKYKRNDINEQLYKITEKGKKFWS